MTETIASPTMQFRWMMRDASRTLQQMFLLTKLKEDGTPYSVIQWRDIPTVTANPAD